MGVSFTLTGLTYLRRKAALQLVANPPSEPLLRKILLHRQHLEGLSRKRIEEGAKPDAAEAAGRIGHAPLIEEEEQGGVDASATAASQEGTGNEQGVWEPERG